MGIYISNELHIKSRNDFSDSNSIEILFIEVIKPRGKNIIIGVIYRPPDQNLDTFDHYFNAIAGKISTENKLCYI